MESFQMNFSRDSEIPHKQYFPRFVSFTENFQKTLCFIGYINNLLISFLLPKLFERKKKIYRGLKG